MLYSSLNKQLHGCTYLYEPRSIFATFCENNNYVPFFYMVAPEKIHSRSRKNCMVDPEKSPYGRSRKNYIVDPDLAWNYAIPATAIPGTFPLTLPSWASKMAYRISPPPHPDPRCVPITYHLCLRPWGSCGSSLVRVLGQNVSGRNVADKMLCGQNVIGQNVTDKMSRIKCRGQNVGDKMSWSICSGQNVLVKMFWSRCPGYCRV